MVCPRRVRWSAPLVLLLILGGAQAAASQGAPAATLIPTVTGPIPVTPTSVPLMASNALQTVIDLPALGYVEEEFFVSGSANVYDWAASGALSVKTPAAPYATRILLRRPADPQRFSGNVIIEIANGARGFDFNFAWGVSHDYFIENGDAFVVLTLAEGNLEGLKAFDPVRYAPLSMANPTPNEACVSARRGRRSNDIDVRGRAPVGHSQSGGRAAESRTPRWTDGGIRCPARVYDRVQRRHGDLHGRHPSAGEARGRRPRL